MTLRTSSGEYVYGSWERGGGSLVRPESAPPARRIPVIDMRGGARREQAASAASKPLELDLVLDSFIDQKKHDAADDSHGSAQPSQRWGEIGARLGSIAAMNPNRGKGANKGNRQPRSGSRGGDKRDGVEKRQVPGVVARNSVAATDGAKQGWSKWQNESHYHRVLEELSSPARLRVRVTVKKPLVMSRTPRHPLQTFRAILPTVLLSCRCPNM